MMTMMMKMMMMIVLTVMIMINDDDDDGGDDDNDGDNVIYDASSTLASQITTVYENFSSHQTKQLRQGCEVRKWRRC